MKKHSKSSGWTFEKRHLAKVRCQGNKPWKKSTGARTAAGKSASSMNARRHGGFDFDIVELRHALHLQSQFVAKYMDIHGLED